MTAPNAIILEVMLKLRNSWSLTGDLGTGSIKFDSGAYDAEVTSPQIVIAPFGGDPSPPLTTGASTAYYRDLDTLSISLWVRPKTDSNTSYGWSKNAIYQMRTEVDRVLRSGSNLGQNSNGDYRFLYMSSWRGTPDTNVRPVVLRQKCTATVVKNVRGV